MWLQKEKKKLEEEREKDGTVYVPWLSTQPQVVMLAPVYIYLSVCKPYKDKGQKITCLNVVAMYGQSLMSFNGSLYVEKQVHAISVLDYTIVVSMFNV